MPTFDIDKCYNFKAKDGQAIRVITYEGGDYILVRAKNTTTTPTTFYHSSDINTALGTNPPCDDYTHKGESELLLTSYWYIKDNLGNLYHKAIYYVYESVGDLVGATPKGRKGG